MLFLFEFADMSLLCSQVFLVFLTQYLSLDWEPHFHNNSLMISFHAADIVSFVYLDTCQEKSLLCMGGYSVDIHVLDLTRILVGK